MNDMWLKIEENNITTTISSFETRKWQMLTDSVQYFGYCKENWRYWINIFIEIVTKFDTFDENNK